MSIEELLYVFHKKSKAIGCAISRDMSSINEQNLIF